MKNLLFKVWFYFMGKKEELFNERVAKKDHAFLGDKEVKIRKLTPALWKELMSVVDQLPGLILHTLMIPRDGNFNKTLLMVVHELMDDIIKIVSVLSGLDEKYLQENAGFDEIVKYLTLTFQKNDFSSVIKNVKSLLPKPEKANE
jgi:hypothetical protein